MPRCKESRTMLQPARTEDWDSALSAATAVSSPQSMLTRTYVANFVKPVNGVTTAYVLSIR